MRMFFCPVNYIDDYNILKLHTMYHKIENAGINKLNEYKVYTDFFFNFPNRLNWFNQLHKRLALEMKHRFQSDHSTPALLDNITYKYYWFPLTKYIDNDINYLKNKWRFKTFKMVYTNRSIPYFLISNPKSILVASCTSCIKKDSNCDNLEKFKSLSGCTQWEDLHGNSLNKFPDFIISNSKKLLKDDIIC